MMTQEWIYLQPALGTKPAEIIVLRSPLHEIRIKYYVLAFASGESETSINDGIVYESYERAEDGAREHFITYGKAAVPVGVLFDDWKDKVKELS